MKEKTALVTGGTDGIGLEIARQLKAKGAKVIVCGRRLDLLDAARADGLEAIAADLSTPDGCDAFVAGLDDRPIDLLVNNAGFGAEYLVTQPIDLAEVERCMAVNFNAPVRLITRMLDGLKARKGTIVNVTSGLAIAPRSGSPIYCATKAALRSFTMALRVQLKPFGVRVIEALPPVVDTAMTAANPRKKMSPQECARQIVVAIERNHDEANVGAVRMLRAVYSISPALARSVMIRF